MTALYYEVTGSGPPVLLLHHGIVDSRVWEPQWRSYADRYRLVRCDFPGFGRTPLEAGPTVNFAQDVVDLLDRLEISGAAIIGCSLGGRVALEVAIARPDLVRALVLVGAGLPIDEPSPAMQAFGEAEEEAINRGDLDAATEVNLRMWVDGPRRQPGDVDPTVRAAIGEMQRHAFAQQIPRWDDLGLQAEPLVEPTVELLGEIRVPTLIVVGDEDVDEMQEFARVFESAIPGSRRATIAGAAHVPNLERPEVFDAVVLGFLAEVL
jgi:3-oxoadipate enol-lactonase